MAIINYPTCINRCYIPKNDTEDHRIETYKGSLLGNTLYYNLNPCMLRLKFAQLAVTDWVVQPIMTVAMIVVEVYTAIRILFNCIPTNDHSLEKRASKSGILFLHALSLPFVMLIPALLAIYSVIDVKNGRHAYCAIEKYMYTAVAMGFSDYSRYEDAWDCSCQPFLTHLAKPFAPVMVVDAYEEFYHP